MDTLKILLLATMALLVGALAVSIKRMNADVAAAPEGEIAALRQQLFEIEQAMKRLEIEKERKLLREAAEAPSGSDAVTRGEVEESKAELEARLAQLEAEAVEFKEDAERAEQEALLMNERFAEDKDKVARRMRVINEAMLIATIQEWVEDPSGFGNFAVLDIERPENVQSGTVLAIRRNGGILGKLRVGEVTIDGAIGNPTKPFGEIKPQRGDELILDEVVKLAN